MYMEHPNFIAPADDKKIWRYNDLAKFVSMLSSSQLFFARVDLLDDKFEGSLPRQTVEKLKQSFQNLPKPHAGMSPDELSKAFSTVIEQYRRYAAVSCWHMNEHESAAMWGLYLKGGEGIAIQSTFARLRDSLRHPEPIYIGQVKYIDYDNEGMQVGPYSLMQAFVHKRKSFEHERELRAVITTRAETEVNRIGFVNPPLPGGLKVEADLKQLVECVYVSPTAPDWFLDVVKSLVDRFGFEFEVRRSKLNDPALF